MNVVKHVDPFFAFGPGPSCVEYLIHYAPCFELSFTITGGLESRLENILVSWHIARVEQTIEVLEEAMAVRLV
jgi:hypothetical protein